MDFTEFDARTPAERGTPCPIIHYDTGEPLTHEGKPCLVLLRGLQSANRMNGAYAAQKLVTKAIEAFKTNDLETAPDEMWQQWLVEGALPMVAGFENCVRDGKPMTVADAKWWLDLKRWPMKPDFDVKTDMTTWFEGHPFPVQVILMQRTLEAEQGNA